MIGIIISNVFIIICAIISVYYLVRIKRATKEMDYIYAHCSCGGTWVYCNTDGEGNIEYICSGCGECELRTYSIDREEV